MKRWIWILIYLPAMGQEIHGQWEANYRATWQNEGMIYWAFVDGEVGSSTGSVPIPWIFTFRWYPLYRKGLPLEVALRFDREGLDRWFTRQIREYTAGLDDLMWLQRSAGGKLNSMNALISQKARIQHRLSQLRLQGDTISDEYKTLLETLHRLNEMEAQLPDMQQWYRSITDSINGLKEMRRWDGWRAGSWLRDRNMLPSWLEPFSYLRSGAIGRFLMTSLPSQISAPFLLNGAEVSAQMGHVEIGIHGGWIEGVIPPWRDIPPAWRLGGFIGIRKDVAHARAGITYWVDSLARHTLSYLSLEQLKVSKQLLISGGAARYISRRRDTTYLLAEGTRIPMFVSREGNAYWADASMSVGIFTLSTGASYYERTFSHPTLPWVVPGQMMLRGVVRASLKRWYAWIGTYQFHYVDTVWHGRTTQRNYVAGVGVNIGRLRISTMGQLTTEGQYLVSGTVAGTLDAWLLSATSTLSTGKIRYQQYSVSVERRKLFRYGITSYYIRTSLYESWIVWLMTGVGWWTTGLRWDFYSRRGHRLWIPLSANRQLGSVSLKASVEPGVQLSEQGSPQPIAQITLQIRHQWQHTINSGN